MNREVHYELTKRWAMEEGFSAEDAETVAEADVAVDRLHPAREWRNTGYHFAWFGANRRARRLFSQAVAQGDLVLLGKALHCVQDAIGHGAIGHVWHWDGIDFWARRSLRVQGRLEGRTRELLAGYLEARAGQVNA